MPIYAVSQHDQIDVVIPSDDAIDWTPKPPDADPADHYTDWAAYLKTFDSSHLSLIGEPTWWSIRPLAGINERKVHLRAAREAGAGGNAAEIGVLLRCYAAEQGLIEVRNLGGRGEITKATPDLFATLPNTIVMEIGHMVMELGRIQRPDEGK